MNKVIFSTKWFDLYELETEEKYSGKFYGIKPPDYVTAVAFDSDGNINLVSQNRPVIKKINSLETPGGQVENGETPKEAIKKELLEELGLYFSEIINVAVLEPDVGRLMNKLHIFRAENPKSICKPEEGIDVIKIKPKEIGSLIIEKKLTNAYSIAALSIVLNSFYK